MWPSLVLCAATLVGPLRGLASAADWTPQDSQARKSRASLEDYLERARARRSELHGLLAARAQAYLAELERLPKDAPPDEIEAAVAGLAELGVDATPLLLPHLVVESAPVDVGDTPNTSTGKAAAPESDAETRQRHRVGVRRADRVAEALRRMPCDPIRGQLLELAEAGPLDARLRALRVLETCEAPAAIRPRLLALYERSDGPLAEAVLAVLISVGGEGQSEFLRAQLERTDAALVDSALIALAELGDRDSADAARSLLAASSSAERHGLALLEYFDAQPDLARGSDVLNFIALAASGAPRGLRIAVLEALPRFDPVLNHDLRSAMKPLVEGQDDELREAALVALATVGDRSSRKALLAGYDDVVERNDRWFRGYSQRGWILLRIGDNDDAIKDFRRALELGKDSQTLQPEVYIGLARASARKGRLKDAADWLRKAPISLDELRALEDDPDFVELRESRWGEEAFGS